MENLKINITTPEDVIDGLRAHLGKITIGDFVETIYVPVECWTLEDYQKQWAEGIERIQKQKKSCLVATVQSYDSIVTLIDWWLLYRHDGKIVIENQLLVSEFLTQTLKGKSFTPETCYQFIKPMSCSKKVSKWVINNPI